MREGTEKEYIMSGKQSVRSMLSELEKIGCDMFIKEKVKRQYTTVMNKIKTIINDTMVTPINKIVKQQTDYLILDKYDHSLDDHIQSIGEDPLQPVVNVPLETNDPMMTIMNIYSLISEYIKEMSLDKTLDDCENQPWYKDIMCILDTMKSISQIMISASPDIYDVTLYTWIHSACKNDYDLYNLANHLMEMEYEIVYETLIGNMKMSDSLSNAIHNI